MTRWENAAVKRGRKAGQRILRPSAASPTSGVPLDFPRRDGCQAGIFFPLDLGTGRRGFVWASGAPT